ncbi:NAD(P)-dependent dehydrogenase (short-subunit alcohol dehydrogenase family) [Lipingzhangella halophila]|uniref:NAD(P)-dependent dehydrogenase (Short-subunit alcohol dehydrogenase family) n=1 Tax=Lipingzhangella halophila TaxID=1783352 RepID=A0A7W7W368_9ACTN|nr:SDR family NAD(P)-dependent oxidoreductase [Lipingzhangella halophila]MBB4932727.1 NAD(P)-dependent dehydrogenase (short-subunit alcohol dehydrogenase family) [Lipingzhangella halophila]
MALGDTHGQTPARRRAVVTGASSGIGEAIARRLAAEGLAVDMVSHSQARLERSAARIRGASPDAELRLERADLSSIAETAKLAERLAAPEPPDIVVSNAACTVDPAETTPEGVTRMLAVNHLAPYLLLRSLVRPIGDRPARFVIVGADPGTLARLPVDLDDLHLRRDRLRGPFPSFRPALGYGRTKNMNAMFGYALAARLRGSAITVNGAHPGVIRDTGLGRNDRGLLRVLGRVLGVLPMPGPDTGADTPSWLATSPEVAGLTGRFFAKRREVPTAPHTTDVDRCDRLWEESARLVGLPVEL